jgi:hypothetical protein
MKRLTTDLMEDSVVRHRLRNFGDVSGSEPCTDVRAWFTVIRIAIDLREEQASAIWIE